MIRSKVQARLLIVDDDPAVLSQLQWGLQDDFEVSTASSPDMALRLATDLKPALVALDLALANEDPESGFRVLDQLLARDPGVKVILVTGREERGLGIRALERGAFDYFTKPVNLEELKVLLGRALAIRELEQENLDLKGEPDDLEERLGRSEAMSRVYRLLARAAEASVAVLLEGEFGTGKEIAAREIHRRSRRAEEPLSVVSCSVLPEAELEQDLFGEAGRLEAVRGGTLLLEDVEALSPRLQLKLLRGVPEDIRFLSTTTTSLKRRVQEGRFRADLFYRLGVVTITLPPLRDRKEDVVLLAEQILERCALEFKRGRLRFNRNALQAIQRYSWPGNLREMEHRIQRAIVLSSGRLIRAEDLQFENPDAPQKPLRAAREEAEREVIYQSLRRNCGNIARASRELQISRPTLHDLLRKFSITAADFKNGIGPELKKEERP